MSYRGISLGGQHKRLHVAKILHIFGGDQDSLERRHRRPHYLLGALSVRRENDILDDLVFAVNCARVGQRLDLHRLAVGVVFPRMREFRLFGGELLDDLVGVDVLGVVRPNRGRQDRPASKKANENA